MRSTPIEGLEDEALATVHGGYAEELFGPMQTAVDMGLTINSTWTGRHADGSAHYDGRAFDAIGSQKDMQRFYNWAAENTTPRQLIFRDGHIKDGRQAGSVGGHWGHVHFSA